MVGFGIGYFCLRVGLSPKGLAQPREGGVWFRTSVYAYDFHGQCVHYYTVRALLYSAYQKKFLFGVSVNNLIQYLMKNLCISTYKNSFILARNI